MTDYDTLLLLAKKIAEVKKEVSALSIKTETVTQKEGPQGLQGPKGDKGDPGMDGKDGQAGRDGKDGSNGKDGQDGKDGVSVVDATVAADGSLVFTLSDGSEVDAGPLLAGNSEGTNVTRVQRASGPNIYVQETPPDSPQSGDIWYDTSTS